MNFVNGFIPKQNFPDFLKSLPWRGGNEENSWKFLTFFVNFIYNDSTAKTGKNMIFSLLRENQEVSPHNIICNS